MSIKIPYKLKVQSICISLKQGLEPSEIVELYAKAWAFKTGNTNWPAFVEQVCRALNLGISCATICTFGSGERLGEVLTRLKPKPTWAEYCEIAFYSQPFDDKKYEERIIKKLAMYSAYLYDKCTYQALLDLKSEQNLDEELIIALNKQFDV